MGTIASSAVKGFATSQRTGKSPRRTLPEGKGGDILRFDFRTPQRLHETHLRLLQGVHTKFADGIALALQAKLQIPVSAAFRSVDQIYYGDFVPANDVHASFYLVRMTEARATGLVTLEPTTVISIVARLLGATDAGEIRLRRITKLEHSVVKGIVQQVVDVLSTAWKGVAAQGLTLDRLANDADLARLMPSNEILVAVAIAITFAEQEYILKTCYPASAIEHILSPDESESEAEDEDEREEQSAVMLACVEQTRVPVVGVLGTVPSSMQELVDLEQGDLLRLDHSPGHEIELVIDGKTRYWGRAGVSNGRVAVKVTRVSGGIQQEGD